MSSVPDKLFVEINHAEELLETSFIRRQRKIPDGGGLLLERTETTALETMAQDLGL